MKNLKYIVLVLLFSVLSLHSESSQTLLDDFDKLDKKTTQMFSIVNQGVQRNLYDILSEYNNPKSRLIQKWFRVATQVRQNEEIGIFIKKTKYKVSALVEQLLFDTNHAITDKDRAVIRNKFNFLAKLAKSDFETLNEECYTTRRVFLRTMPIVDTLTNHKDSRDKNVMINPKSNLNILYKFSYIQEDNKETTWGYVESLQNDRRGWINLKNTDY